MGKKGWGAGPTATADLVKEEAEQRPQNLVKGVEEEPKREEDPKTPSDTELHGESISRVRIGVRARKSWKMIPASNP